MNFLELKPLTPALLPAAVELDHLCFGRLWTLEGYQREVDSPNSDLFVLQSTHLQGGTAREEVPLLGLACLWAILEEAHITILAVHPAYQRQGLGQVLLHQLMTSAWQRGLEWATLEVRASNQGAIALYQKFGFQEVGRRRQYYPDTQEDALILWRKGLQSLEFPTLLQDWKYQIDKNLSQSGWCLQTENGGER